MKVLTVDFNDANASAKFTESLINTGFAVVANHPISTTLVDNTYQDWIQFFSQDEKFNYVFNKDTQDGYFPLAVSETAKGAQIKDIKQFFQYYPWGQYPLNVKPYTKTLYDDLSAFAGTLLQWIEANTPSEIAAQFSMPLCKMIENSHKTMLRILHYPELQGDEEQGAIRAAAHEDINLITLLVAATAPGLQVKDMQGNWHNVECDPGTIVVNTGDMLQMCSNNFYRSTTHRVVNPEGEAAKLPRLSMPLFLHPRDEVRLSANYTAVEYLNERLRELGLK